MKAIAVLALCLAVVGAGPVEPDREGAWWQMPEPRPEDRSEPSSAYLSLRGKMTFSEEKEDAEPRPRPEMPRPQWSRPEPEPMRPGVNMNMSPEEFYQYQIFKKMMEEKRQQEEKERKQNEEFAKLDEVMGKFDEAKHKFLFSVTLGLVKICQCHETAMDVDMMFGPQSNATMGSMPTANTTMSMGGEMDEQDHVEKFLKLVHGKAELTSEIVGKMKQMQMSDMKKLAFGGLVKSLCWEYKSYVTSLKSFKAKFHDMATRQGMGGNTWGDMS